MILFISYSKSINVMRFIKDVVRSLLSTILFSSQLFLFSHLNGQKAEKEALTIELASLQFSIDLKNFKFISHLWLMEGTV